jgi:hypothetical protein
MDITRYRLGIVAVAVLLALLVVPAIAWAQPSYPNEEEEQPQRRDSHFGLGLGFATSTSVVHEVFGDGTDASIYVNQRIWKVLGVRGTFGAIALGAPNPEAEFETYLTGFEFFGSSFTNFSLGFTYLTVGPSVQLRFGENHSVLASAAVGFYDVKMDLASLGAHRFTPQNKRRGLNATLQYSYWIGSSWGLNARFDVHQIYTKTEDDDLYHTFVRGDADPRFNSFLIGVHVGYR